MPTTPPKGLRSKRRNQKHDNIPNSLAISANTRHGHLTPPSSAKSGHDGVEAYDSSNIVSDGAYKRKNGEGRGKRNRNVSKQSAMSIHRSHRHSSSHPSMVSSPKESPLTNAYAGPTFHASPAPSALPMPNFFSKSLPASSSSHQSQSRNQNLSEQLYSTPTKSRPHEPSSDGENKSSPLDFLFRAAREAQAMNAKNNDNSGVESPSRCIEDKDRNSSDELLTDGPNEIFPIEIDSLQTPKIGIGPSFATPYKDRMNALRSTSSPAASLNGQPLDEIQRKAKSQALKSLLSNPSPQIKRPVAAPSIFNPNPDGSMIRNHSVEQTFSSVCDSPYINHSHNPVGDDGALLNGDQVAYQYLSSITSRSTSTALDRHRGPRHIATGGVESPCESPENLSPPIRIEAPYHSLNNQFTTPTPSYIPPAAPGCSKPMSMSRDQVEKIQQDLRRILNLDS